jgi:phosphate:Na+ symporter
MLFPLGGFILKVAERMAGREAPVVCNLTELDESIIETPKYALENSKKAISRLMEYLDWSLKKAVNTIVAKDDGGLAAFEKNMADVDRANDTIGAFLSKLYGEKLTGTDNAVTTRLLLNLASMNRISSHCKKLVKLAAHIREGVLSYSEEAITELRNISSFILSAFSHLKEAYETGEGERIAEAVRFADEADEARQVYKQGQMNRAVTGGHDIQAGLTFAEAARHMARISHHIKSIAESMKND